MEENMKNGTEEQDEKTAILSDISNNRFNERVIGSKKFRKQEEVENSDEAEDTDDPGLPESVKDEKSK